MTVVWLRLEDGGGGNQDLIKEDQYMLYPHASVFYQIVLIGYNPYFGELYTSCYLFQ